VTTLLMVLSFPVSLTQRWSVHGEIQVIYILIGITLPLFVACCSFRRLPLARIQCAMVGCCLLLSTALFVIAHRPAIVDDVASSLLFGPNAVVLVVIIVAGGGTGLLAGTKPWRRTSWSFSASGRSRRLSGEARGPALAAVVIVLAAFGPNAVILVVVVIAGGVAGLSAGTKPWWRTAVVVVLAARREDQR
jgi:hypothetical protein